MALTHLDGDGNVAMVDISHKPGTLRIATASGHITMQPETLRLLMQELLPKGNVLTTAKLAGIMAAKNTAGMIPLCHQLNLSWADIAFEIGENRIVITSTVKTKESTGLEMEALSAVSVAALTIYDMCKAVDKTMEIGGISLVKKTGGKTGETESFRPRTSILVLSDSVYAGLARDRSGELLRNGFESAGCEVDEVK
ncbi:MAG: bifunctional molybdenum cofactor biosynthesis protein MoaC/MoaB, partial [Chlorobiaceae bacterium]|nr:bifunctional molybdenum cofactor biosynthesis protein MoaC/MoaB [Chlorobiaceae bacterium]